MRCGRGYSQRSSPTGVRSHAALLWLHPALLWLQTRALTVAASRSYGCSPALLWLQPRTPKLAGPALLWLQPRAPMLAVPRPYGCRPGGEGRVLSGLLPLLWGVLLGEPRGRGFACDAARGWGQASRP